MVPDGAGGVYALWTDARDFPTNGRDVYASHVLANGAFATGWPTNGRVVCDAVSSQGDVQGCSDGQGGVIVAWTDFRNGDEYANTNPDIYAVRLMGDGSVAPGWTEGGIPLAADSAAHEWLPVVESDGLGGAYVTHWLGSPSTDIRVLRVHGTGAFDSGWPTGGVSATDHHDAGLPSACSDGSGGLFVAWTDERTYVGFPPPIAFTDVYATYLLSDGSFAPGWGVNGLPIAAKLGGEFNVRVAEDGLGHFLLTWNDHTAEYGGGRSMATRILRDGTRAPGWPSDGALVTTRVGAEFYSDICADGSGGAFAVAESWESNQFVIAQRFTATGTVAPGWSPDGVTMWPIPGHQSDPVVVPSPPGSAIAVWYDSRGPADIYAQRLVLDGVVATTLSLVSAEASSEGVRVVGHAHGPTGEVVALERQRSQESWREIVTLTVPANGRIEYVDRDVRPGERLGYRLVRGGGPTLEYSSEIWVQVPLGETFALIGFRPNPSPPRPIVEFTVARSEAVRLEVFDPAGRRRHTLDLASPVLGAQSHPLPVALDPGLYWLRLTQGNSSASRTAVVVD